jgi:hypothetical protein
MLSLLVLSVASCRKNHPPRIESVTSSPLQVKPSDNATIVAVASDEDKDSLTYTWTASGGFLSARQGAGVTWKAPDSAGTYTITLVVADGAKGADTGTAQVTVLKVVKSNRPSTGQLIRDAKGVLSDATAKLNSYGFGGPTNLRVGSVTVDDYETNLCQATVLYDLASFTGVVGLSYRWNGEFWQCTGGSDLGMK